MCTIHSKIIDQQTKLNEAKKGAFDIASNEIDDCLNKKNDYASLKIDDQNRVNFNLDINFESRLDYSDPKRARIFKLLA